RIAEARLLPEVFAQALTTKAIMLAAHGRIQEGMALLRFALDTALEHDKPVAALRASYNLADNFSQIDRYEEAAVTVREGLVQERATYAGSMARIFLVEGDPAEATKAAAFPLELRETMGNRQEYVKEAWVTAVEGALDTGDLNRARDLLTILDELPPGNTSQF